MMEILDMVVIGTYFVNLPDEEVEGMSNEEIIERAKTSFDYDIQDKDVHSFNLKWKINEN